MTAGEFGAGLLWFVLYALAVFIGVRLWPRRSPAIIAVGTALLAAVFSLPAAHLLRIDANYWRSLFVFAFFSIVYLMAFGAVYKSISLRMLLDLSRAPARRMRADDLFSHYVGRESFQARIEVMVAQGYAKRSSGGIQLTPKGHRLAVAVESIQGIFRIASSG